MAIDNQFGFFRDVKLDENGNVITKQDDTQFQLLLDELKVINGVPYFIDVNEGNVPGVTPFSKFGRNSDIDTNSAPEDVWNGANIYTGMSEESETLEIFSSSPSDTAGGIGARTITLSNLLDENNNEMPDVTVTLNGTTPVLVDANIYHRCSRMFTETAGSSNENVGSITLRHTTTTANVFAVMPPILNQTQIFAFTVPMGKTLYIPNFSIKMSRANGSAGSANCTVKMRMAGSNVWRTIRNTEITDSQSFTFSGLAYFVAPEGTDIKTTVESVSDNNTIITGEADGFLVDNV